MAAMKARRYHRGNGVVWQRRRGGRNKWRKSKYQMAAAARGGMAGGNIGVAHQNKQAA